MQEFKPVKEGKVREIYDIGENLVIVATDRISCFDVILNNKIEKKGTVLTQLSKFWFEMTKDILPNHMISVDVNDMPEFFRKEEFDGNSMLCRKLKISGGVHCARLYNGKWLGELQGKWNRLRHPSAGGVKRIRQTPATDLYAVHKSRNR